jgi:hypothetical protein
MTLVKNLGPHSSDHWNFDSGARVPRPAQQRKESYDSGDQLLHGSRSAAFELKTTAGKGEGGGVSRL